MKTVSNAWLSTWALAYIVAAIFAPGISGDVLTGIIFYSVLGIAILSTLSSLSASNPDIRTVGMICLIVLAIVEVFGAIASWSGLAMWNVPFPSKEIFQVTMGLMDFLSAVFMLIRFAIEV